MQYRDKQTGKFVKASTWKRSKAQGGTRYVRQNLPKGEKSKGGAYAEPLKTASRGGGSPARAPSVDAIKTAKDYIDMYDDFTDYEDAGEYETGVDY